MLSPCPVQSIGASFNRDSGPVFKSVQELEGAIRRSQFSPEDCDRFAKWIAKEVRGALEAFDLGSDDGVRMQYIHNRRRLFAAALKEECSLRFEFPPDLIDAYLSTRDPEEDLSVLTADFLSQWINFPIIDSWSNEKPALLH